MSLPIPDIESAMTYRDAGFGEEIEAATHGRISAAHGCHLDPQFHDGRVAFGQTGAALSHLLKNGVDVGDVFLFFGRFRDAVGALGHRIFGWMRVDDIHDEGEQRNPRDLLGAGMVHPHTEGRYGTRNTIFLGEGWNRAPAVPELCLTQPHGPLSAWIVPEWPNRTGLTYHARPDRWTPPNRLRAVSRGQEFIADIGDCPVALQWITQVTNLIGPARGGAIAHIGDGQ